MPRRATASALQVAWALVPALAFAYALSFSWGRWGEIVIDWGRELEVARRIAAGDVLYADLHYWYGPLPPYLNALLFTLFGVHTRVLQAAGLVCTVLMTSLLWALARRLAGPTAAATVAGAFVLLCGFGHYYLNDIFNWVTPYAYPATYGMLLATASLYALVRHVERPQAGGWWLASLVLLALSLLSKVEPALAAATGHLAYVGARVANREPSIGRLLAGYVAVGVMVAAVVGGFVLHAGAGGIQGSAFSQASSQGAAPILHYMGITEWRTALPLVLASALRLGAAFATPLLLARFGGPNPSPGIRAVLVLIAFVVPIVAFSGVPADQALRAMPLVALAGFGDAVVRFLRRRDDPASVTDAVVWAFALGALVRLPLTAGAHHYGFYLLPVPLAALLLVWFRRLPQLVPAGLGPTLAALTGGALALTLAWTHAQASAAMYRRHTAHLTTPRADLWLLNDVGGVRVGEIYRAAVERLRTFPRETTVLAVPDGAGLAFAAGLPMWGSDFSYYPPETDATGDARLRANLEAHPPGAIVLLNLLDLRQYGALGFGRDYATRSVAWIQEHCAVDQAFTGNAVVIARPR